MAQLPPRVPNMVTNWPQFSPYNISTTPPMENNNNNPSWVDELLDFSAKRGSHRRSMSDSVAFLDIPMAEECRRSSIPGSGSGSGSGSGGGGHVFDKFDDEQLMSMFTSTTTTTTDDVMGSGSGGPNMISSSNPSSPSDINVNNMNEDIEKEINNPSSDQLNLQQMMMKSEPEEVESSCKSAQIGSMDNSNDKIVDPKRIKRILANRQSAQRSRVRKLQYVSELERSVTSLQGEISVLSPRVAYLDHQRLILGVDNSVLKQRIAALAQDKIFKDAHQEALKREIERLRQVYNYQQNIKKKENAASQQHHESPTHVNNIGYAEKEQLAN